MTAASIGSTAKVSFPNSTLAPATIFDRSCLSARCCSLTIRSSILPIASAGSRQMRLAVSARHAVMAIMRRRERPCSRFLVHRRFELGDGGKHRQHGKSLLPQLDTGAGDDLRPILSLGKVLFFGEAPDDGEQARQLFATLGG